MTTACDPTFDFDSWADLAKSDAEAFEQRRRDLIEAFIADAPEHMQARLRRVQWRVDAERRRYKHPLKSCVMVFDMMWDSLYGDHGLLQALLALNDPDGVLGGGGESAKAQILNFRHKPD